MSDHSYRKIKKCSEKCCFVFASINDFPYFVSLFESIMLECINPSSQTVDDVKGIIKFNLQHKSDNQRHGSVAEIFSHIIIQELNFKQRSFFSNLENNGPKQGFDGFYIHNNEYWIGESKSTSDCKHVHYHMLKKAYDDLYDKIENKGCSNDPWNNALNHLQLCEIKFNEQGNYENFKNQLQEFSKDFINGKGQSIDNFNLIPVSTLFVPNKQTIEDIIKDVVDSKNMDKYKKILFICIDNKLYDEFIKYIGL